MRPCDPARLVSQTELPPTLLPLALPFQAPEPEDVGLAQAVDRRLSSSACSVNRLQQGQGAALRLEVVRNLEPPAVLVQVRIGRAGGAVGQGGKGG